MERAELIMKSVVAISADEPMEDISPALMSKSPTSGEYVMQGLGFLSGERIFTCAGYQDRLPLLPGYADIYAAWCLNDQEIPRGLFASYFTSSMNFTVLEPDGMSVVMSEAGGTETSLEMINAFEEKYADAVSPSELVFADGIGAAKLPGYYFGVDGKTVHQTILKVWDGSATIEFWAHSSLKGCGGSPIFTADHKYVGFFNAATTAPMQNGYHHCLGTRIDMAVPCLLHRRILWDRLDITDARLAADDPDDPWNKQQAAADAAFNS